MPMLPIARLMANPFNPRHTIDPAYIAELAQSMTEHGQWESILVRVIAPDEYQVIAGHCRVEAARSLGWEEIRAEVREMTDEESDFLTLDTNLKRRNLSEVEEAEGIRRMIDVHGWTQREAAERFGKSQAWINRRLDLLGLAAEVQQQVITRVISPTHAREIAQAPPEVQLAIAKKGQQEDLSTRETEHLVRVVSDPTVPEKVKRAALEEPKVTAAHAEAIARAPAPAQEEMIREAASGRLTADQAEKQAATERWLAERPPTITGEQVARRLKVFPHLDKAEQALEEIKAEAICELDIAGLYRTMHRLQDLADQLSLIYRWASQVVTQREGGKKKGKIVAFRYAENQDCQ